MQHVFFNEFNYICNSKNSTVDIGNLKGELSEWPKEHAWKVCISQKGIESSNLSLSADRLSKTV